MMFQPKEAQLEPRILLGRALIVAGILIVLVGIALLFTGRIPFLGKLPGDINIQGKNWSLHFPVVTGIVISLILTLILNLFFRR